MVQVVPSHSSISASCFPSAARCTCPTATQDVAEAHETELKMVWSAPAGVGAAWVAQLPPEKRSMSGCRSPVVPAAVHSVVDEHETPRNEPPPPGNAGVVCTVHPVPFHVWATGPETFAPPEKPTAVQRVAPGHE